tara:strand:- start:395 stop:1615 length:1221 start_codon:yes stop_codon:yes gene_type:complete
MQIFYIFILSGLIYSNLFSQEINDKSRLLVDFQQKLIDDKITASNQILIFKDNKIVYQNIQNSFKQGDKKITSKSLFPIWSMSKVITTIGILQLIEKGAINLTDPVSKYIPSFSNLNCMLLDPNNLKIAGYGRNEERVYECKNELQIIHLLSHRSGFATPENFYVDAIRADDLEELMEIISKEPLNYEPGTKYLYGVNQSILGRIAEVASGKSFDTYLKEDLFVPLEMFNTGFYIDKKQKKQLQPLYINQGNLEGFNQDGITWLGNMMTYQKESQTPLGAEGIITTTEDFSNFCKMLVHGGVFNGKQILNQKSINLMTEKFSESYPKEYWGEKYLLGFYKGLSVFVLEDPKKMNLKAPKKIFGWPGLQNTFFWIDPENSLYGIFMSRSMSNGLPYDALLNKVYQIF